MRQTLSSMQWRHTLLLALALFLGALAGPAVAAISESLIKSSSSVTLKSTHADGSTAVAAIVDTSTAWTDVGAKFLSVRTNAVEKFSTGYHAGGTDPNALLTGNGFFESTGTLGVTAGGGALTLRANGGASYLYLDTSTFYMATGATNRVEVDSTGMYASTDGAVSLGKDTHGFKGLQLSPVTAPSNPASGWIIYCDSGDGNKLKIKASTGTTATLGTP